MRIWPVVVLAVACGSEPGAESGRATESSPGVARAASAEVSAPTAAAPVAAAAPAATPGAAACRAEPFERAVDVAEASGAVWVEASFGLPAHIIVVGDSGTRGAFAIIDAATGAPLGKGHLPLDRAASDDLEGLARSGGVYYALTSGGSMRHFRRTGADRFELTVKAYPLAGASCDSPRKTNCGRDYEGLCLADPLPATGCAGFAASRRDGELVCLRRAGDRLRPDTGTVIKVAPQRALSGCDFAPATDGGQLYTVTNLFGGNAILRVRGWRQPGSAAVEPVASAGVGFVETLAVGPGGAIVHFSDTASPTSGMGKYSCPRPGPE